MICLIKNPYLFVTTEPNRMGVFAEMQIISYNIIILKHIQINSQFRKILMLKVRLSFFWGQSVYHERSFINRIGALLKIIAPPSDPPCGTLRFELHSGNMKSELIKKITSLDTSRRSKLQEFWDRGLLGHFLQNSTQFHTHALKGFMGFSDQCHSHGSVWISDLQFHFVARKGLRLSFKYILASFNKEMQKPPFNFAHNILCYLWSFSQLVFVFRHWVQHDAHSDQNLDFCIAFKLNVSHFCFRIINVQLLIYFIQNHALIFSL